MSSKSRGLGCSERPEEHLRDLDEEQPGWWEDFRMVPMGFREVEVSRIIGSIGHGEEFRPDWAPFVSDERDRGLTDSFLARGFDSNESNQSPITLVEYSGEFYVEADGHRRVSVAHQLKLRALEAEVFNLERKELFTR